MLKRYVDDYDLVQECRMGDTSAYRVLVDRLKGKISIAVSSKVPPRDAPDLIQDVFTAIVYSINENRYLGKSALEGYVNKIATNKVADYYRNGRRMKSLFSDEEVLPEEIEGNDPWDLVDNDILLQQLSSDVSGNNMEVIKLKLAGLDFGEISKVVGVSYEGTRSRYRRGIKQIRTRASIYRSIELRRRY